MSAGSVYKPWKKCCFCSQRKEAGVLGRRTIQHHHRVEPVSRASTSCPALIFWAGLARILSAWPAWWCHPTWLCCPNGQGRIVRAVVGYLSTPLTQTSFSFCVCVMHPQSQCPILSLICLFITLCQRHTHTHAHHWQNIMLDLWSPMGRNRNMFVWRYSGIMADNQRHLLLHSASIISTQDKPN